MEERVLMKNHKIYFCCLLCFSLVVSSLNLSICNQRKEGEEKVKSYWRGGVYVLCNTWELVTILPLFFLSLPFFATDISGHMKFPVWVKKFCLICFLTQRTASLLSGRTVSSSFSGTSWTILQRAGVGHWISAFQCKARGSYFIL